MSEIDASSETLIDGKYQILGLAGEGGSGSVQRAIDIELDRLVAIKVLLSSHAGEPHALLRLQREALLLSKMDHPHVAKIYSFGIDVQKGPYLVMEWLDGKTLSRHIASRGCMSIEEWATIARQLCDAIAYAHSQQIIHRDIKPSNILFVGTGDKPLVKIVDFGMAKPLQSAPGTITTGSNPNVATPIYASPEQYGAGSIDHRTDIYSLSCVFYEMLAGKPPYVGGTVFQTMMQKLETTAPLIPALAQYPVLEGAILKGLSPKPEDRFTSMIEYREAIEKALQQPAVPHAVQRRPATRKRPIRNRAFLFGGAIVLTLVAVGGALIVGESFNEADSEFGSRIHTWQDARKEALAAENLSRVSKRTKDQDRARKTFDHELLLIERAGSSQMSANPGPEELQHQLERIDVRLDLIHFFMRGHLQGGFIDSKVQAARHQQEAMSIIDKLEQAEFPLAAELARRKWRVLDTMAFQKTAYAEFEEGKKAAAQSLELRKQHGTATEVFAGRQRIAEVAVMAGDAKTANQALTDNFAVLRASRSPDDDEKKWALHIFLWAMANGRADQHEAFAVAIEEACTKWLPSTADPLGIRKQLLKVVCCTKHWQYMSHRWGIPEPPMAEARPMVLTRPEDQL